MAHKNQRDWGGDNEKLFLRMLEQGHSQRAIALTMQTTAGTLKRHYGHLIQAHRSGCLAEIWTSEQRELVRGMIGVGLSQAETATILKMSEDSLKRHFPEEIRTGRQMVHALVATSMVRLAIAGDVGAGKFVLARQFGWREEVDIRARVEGNHVVEHAIAEPDAREALGKFSKDGREHIRLALGDLGVRSAVVDEGPSEEEVIH